MNGEASGDTVASKKMRSLLLQEKQTDPNKLLSLVTHTPTHTLGPSWCHRYLDLTYARTQAPRRVKRGKVEKHRQTRDLSKRPYRRGDRADRRGRR